ncbi:MAG TPA: hypothetical protein VM936_17775 [Pyrinomonadaceae bacterium]|jgi:hypothetical protein|nr:hypothetical protein [Pyrinomonadaceae bacterium]
MYMYGCLCATPPFFYKDFETASLGVDFTKGRNAEVTVETCRACGSMWLRYFVEWEWLSESGRWYRGPVTPEMVESLKPEQAPELLSSLPWYFYGGSYFRTPGRKGSGPLNI